MYIQGKYICKSKQNISKDNQYSYEEKKSKLHEKDHRCSVFFYSYNNLRSNNQ